MSLIGSTEVKKKLIGRVHLLREIPGYSAYDLAVKHGFKGTEEEWVASIKGERGKPGTLESHTEVDALGHRVINVAEPMEDTDAVTKGYADENYAYSGKANRSMKFDASGEKYGLGMIYKANIDGESPICIEDVTTDGRKLVLHIDADSSELWLTIEKTDGTKEYKKVLVE